MFQIVVCDFDGTLVSSEKDVSRQVLTKLHNLAMRGIIFAVASGRPYNQLKRFFEPVKSDIVFIASDGAQIMYRNCVLAKNTISTDDAKKISRMALDCELVPIAALREENRRITREALALPFLFSSDIFKIVVAKNKKSAEKLKALVKDIHSVRICYEDDDYIEFCSSSSDKGEATKKLMQKFSCPSDKLAVIGDGENDIPMLKLTQNRYRPACAYEQVFDIAKEIDVEEFILNL